MDNNPFSLEGHHVLVTGASSGIGRAIAVESARMGARLTILGRNPERLEQTLADLNGTGHHAVRFDLKDSDGVAALLSAIKSVDGVVHSAGITHMAPAKFISQADFDEIMAVNVYAAMELIKQLLTNKKINKTASLVFISSVVGGILPYKGQGVYAASKGALSAYTKVLALELAARGMRANSIAPAMVRTPLLDSLGADSAVIKADEQRYPLGYGTPEDVAWAAVYLLSRASRWMTGNNLVIDGGVTLT